MNPFTLMDLSLTIRPNSEPLTCYRVSKKYERTGYNGKFTFRKDSRFSEEELDQKRKNLQNLEKLFRESRKLVAKMQDAKGGGKKQVSPGATINFSSNYGDLPAMQSMDQHLALLRLQISGGGGRGLMPPSSSAAFGGLRAASTSRADLLQAMIMSRNGWSPYSPMMMGLRPAAGEGILQELAQRRQQLLRSNTVMAGMANPLMPFPSSAYGTGCGNASSLLSGPTKTHERRHLGKVDGEATPAQPACETLKRGLGALTSAAAIASPVDERKKEVSNAKRPHIS